MHEYGFGKDFHAAVEMSMPRISATNNPPDRTVTEWPVAGVALKLRQP